MGTRTKLQLRGPDGLVHVAVYESSEGDDELWTWCEAALNDKVGFNFKFHPETLEPTPAAATCLDCLGSQTR